MKRTLTVLAGAGALLLGACSCGSSCGPRYGSAPVYRSGCAGCAAPGRAVGGPYGYATPGYSAPAYGTGYAAPGGTYVAPGGTYVAPGGYGTGVGAGVSTPVGGAGVGAGATVR